MDARTGPLPEHSLSRRKCSSLHSRHWEPGPTPEDARSCGGGGSRRGKSGLRALQELVSDTKTATCANFSAVDEGPGGLAPSRLPQPLPTRHKQRKQQQQQQQQQLEARGPDFDDFIKYLGISDFSASEDKQKSPRRPENKHLDQVSNSGDDADVRLPSRRQLTEHLTQLVSPSTAPAGDDFYEERQLCQLVASMLAKADRAGKRMSSGYWDLEAAASALRHFVDELGDRSARLRLPGAFPFNQPELQMLLNLLTANSSAKGNSEQLRQVLTDVRSLHWQMRLFLWPEAVLSEADDATLSNLLIVFAEQVDEDLRHAAPNSVQPSGFARFARRRAAALAAALDCYAQTAERRRQQILGRMQSLANTVMAFVARCPADGVGDGGFHKSVMALFDDMQACFTSLGSVSGHGASVTSGQAAGSSAAGDLLNVSEDDGCSRSFGRGDTPSHLPPPPPAFLQPPEEAAATEDANSEAEAVVSDSDRDSEPAALGRGDIGAAEAASGAVEPLEAMALQFIEQTEVLLSSFLPNERVNNQDFKNSFNAMFEWWRRAVSSTDLAGHVSDRRMSSVREKFDRAQQLRVASNGVRRLYSEAETVWDLIEVARLMVPSEDRTACLAEVHTAAEWREAVLSLVDSALATLYLYQSAQDASVLSTRLRCHLQRLSNRLADCGPVPMFSLLRLRLGYLRQRQFSDLMRPHPQGCLIVELAQMHRVLNRDAYPEAAVFSPLNLTLCVPLSDYRKFDQHVKDMRVLSFEARAPLTEKTGQLLKSRNLRKIEKCCQCSIEVLQPGSSGPASDTATCGATSCSPATAADGTLTACGRRKPQLIVGGQRPTLCLIVRPEISHGRANAAMRMICEIVGPAGIGERVKYCAFHLALQLPANYKPLTVFADNSRQLTY